MRNFGLTICYLLLLMAAAVRAEEANCLGCHSASADAPVHAIFNSVHGVSGGAGTCISCHGASAGHAGDPVKNSPDTSFGPRWVSGAEQRDNSCLACHKGGAQMHWLDSVHQQEELGCTACHTLHTTDDKVLRKSEQAETCYGCHAQQRMQAKLPSRHPIIEGKTACSDCHNSHGSSAEFSLRQPTLNDNCYSCHAEKRGPFLFEHPPVAEDCSICHTAHGSVNADLLTARGPFLCQQCHSAAFHPSQVYSGTGLPDNSPNQNLIGKNCLNCHGQIHGSNHPSGARLTR